MNDAAADYVNGISAAAATSTAITASAALVS
jgi:hypothetical protein